MLFDVEWIIKFETAWFSWHDLNKDGLSLRRLVFKKKNIPILKKYKRCGKRIS